MQIICIRFTFANLDLHVFCWSKLANLYMHKIKIGCLSKVLGCESIINCRKYSVKFARINSLSARTKKKKKSNMEIRFFYYYIINLHYIEIIILNSIKLLLAFIQRLLFFSPNSQFFISNFY
jgi:hypothetical protein